MKFPRILFAALLAVAACERKPASTDNSDQRQADERRIAELRDLEQRAADREAAARNAELDAAKQKLEAERSALERDRANLTADQQRAEEQRIAALQQKQQQDADAERRAEQKRRADEKVPAEREDRPVPTAARGAQKLDFFYDALDPEGDWQEVADYGYVWQPRQAANPHWRPYTDGKWAWTEYGWTWVSNEKFGWATYHYGRWVRMRQLGWVWVPGSEWAPAWVAWRRGNDAVGWAPLPPSAHSGSGFNAAVDSYYDIGPSSYTFVPVEQFGENTYVGRVIEPERNVTFINQTTNITNVSYRRVDNGNAIYNGGPDLNFFESRSRSPVQHFTVGRLNDPRAAGPAVQRGNVLQMVAPFIAAAARATTAPARVKQRAPAAEVDRGWNGDQQAIQQVRAKVAQEAHTAEEAQRAAPRPQALPVVAPVAIPPRPRIAPALAQPVAPPAVDPAKVEVDRRRLEHERAAAAKVEVEAATPVPRPKVRPATPLPLPVERPERRKVVPPVAPPEPAALPDVPAATPVPRPPRPPAPKAAQPNLPPRESAVPAKVPDAPAETIRPSLPPPPANIPRTANPRKPNLKPGATPPATPAER